MAEVWQATDERLGRIVAIKILREDAMTPEDLALARRRFRDEGRLAARQIHRNIVAVFDAGTHHGRAYLVMEHLSGMTLRDRLARGTLSDREARDLLSDVLAALDVAHQSGIAHRDIKPSNILHDGEGRWKVADFGIAKALDDAPVSDLTLTGQVIGTPRYMAPERLAGRPATEASDLYSVGLLLAESLGDREDADPVLRAVAARATSANPADRYPTARAMAEAANDLQGEETVAFLPGGVSHPVEVLRQSARPRSTSDEATTIATPGPSTQALPRPVGSRPRNRAGLIALVLSLLLVSGVLAAVTRHDDAADVVPKSPAAATSTTQVPATTASTTLPAVAATEATTTTVPTTTSAVPAPKPEPKGKGQGKGKGKGKA